MQSASRPLALQELAKFDHDPALILQMLRNLQLEQNVISAEDIAELSDTLNISKTKIKALIDFYSFLHDQPRGQLRRLLLATVLPTTCSAVAETRATVLCRGPGRTSSASPSEEGACYRLH